MVPEEARPPTHDNVDAVAARCDNTGRWGAADRLGTLNYITPDVRLAAAREVQVGQTVSLARVIDTSLSAVNPRPAWHIMHLETERPYASADSLHLQVHGLANTHLDALGHMFLDGVGYNGVRQDAAVDMGGLRQRSSTPQPHPLPRLAAWPYERRDARVSALNLLHTGHFCHRG